MLSVERGVGVALSDPLGVCELVCEAEPEGERVARSDAEVVALGCSETVADALGDCVAEPLPEAELDAEALCELELVAD